MYTLNSRGIPETTYTKLKEYRIEHSHVTSVVLVDKFLNSGMYIQVKFRTYTFTCLTTQLQNNPNYPSQNLTFVYSIMLSNLQYTSTPL